MEIGAHHNGQEGRPQMRHHNGRTSTHDRNPTCDLGYTLVELLAIVVIVGMLGTLSILSVSGVTTEAAETGCQSDHRALSVATELYFAQSGADSIPGSGAADADQHERTLADSGFLRSPSSYYNIAADGAITPEENSPC